VQSKTWPEYQSKSAPAWEEKGIVGRGILLDFDRWRRANNVEYRPLVGNGDAITLDHLKAVAKSQGTEIKFGDILIIRTGRSLSISSWQAGK
jgi:hypothetical protein